MSTVEVKSYDFRKFFLGIADGSRDSPLIEVLVKLVEAALANDNLSFDQPVKMSFDMAFADPDYLKVSLMRNVRHLVATSPGQTQDKI